jgi:hypothetical protein
MQLLGGLVAALLASEERDGERLGVGAGEGVGDVLDVALLPALDAVAITNRRPMAKVMALSAVTTLSGVQASFS